VLGPANLMATCVQNCCLVSGGQLVKVFPTLNKAVSYRQEQLAQNCFMLLPFSLHVEGLY
jgi:hypothetical protein